MAHCPHAWGSEAGVAHRPTCGSGEHNGASGVHPGVETTRVGAAAALRLCKAMRVALEARLVTVFDDVAEGQIVSHRAT